MSNSKSTNVFDEMGIYWAEIAAENSTETQLTFIKNHVKMGRLILDLACGTGRHINPLSKEGYFVVGLDVSINLLRIAKHSGYSQLVCGDIRYLPFRSNIFSYVLSMDTSFGYLPSEQEDLKSIKEISRILEMYGIFLLDIFNGEYLILKILTPYYRIKNIFKSLLFWVLKHYARRSSRLFLSLVKWRQYPSFFLFSRRSIDKSQKRLNELWVVRDKSDDKLRIYRHSVRLYDLAGLKAMLKQANMKVDRVFGDYRQEEFGSSSKRLIVIAYST